MDTRAVPRGYLMMVERAENVAADGGIGGMIDGPSMHQGLGGSEKLLHLQKVSVAQHRLKRRDLRVGTQHEDAVVAGLLGQLAGIDLESGASRSFGLLAQPDLNPAQVAPAGGVADQRLVALFQLAVERRDDGGTVRGVLLRFRLIAADDVVLALDDHLL